MEAFTVLLGTLAIGGVVYWLHQMNVRDRQRMAEILGLAVLKKGAEESGDDYIRGKFNQTLLMCGEMHGHPAAVWLRGVRRSSVSTSNSRNLYSVLAFDLPPGTQASFRIEPALAGKLLAFFGGDQPALPTGDEAFDKLFRFTSQDPGAVAKFMTPEMRGLLLAFRQGVVGDMPDSALGRASGDMLMGTFAVEPGCATYTVSGTPSEKIARHFEVAARFLAEFARQVRALG